MKSSYSFCSSSSSKLPKKYDVFLSFRGEDTRNNFTGFLHDKLKEKGIHTFIDDTLERGNDISEELLETIEESSCSIIVLSTNYANSTWCLKELIKILDCKKTREQIVLPIFFLVEPTHVTNKIGAFGEAFIKHKQDFRDRKEKAQMTENERKNIEADLKRWEDALTEVGKIAGWHLTESHHQAKFINEFVLEVSKKYVGSPLPKGVFGMRSRMEKLDSYVHKSKNGVEFIGICGMGGIGKSTIARTFYELNKCQFEGSSFLGKVKDKRNDLESVVKQLLSDTLKGECTTNAGDISKRLCRKKVLVVIDDVDDLYQLDTLAGEPNWFGSGSRIIITTRDKHLLNAHEVKEIYHVEPLDDDEGFQLFTWKAGFKDAPPHFSNEYKTLPQRFVKYAHGLPLALQVLGSALRGKDVDEWNDQLDRLRNNPKTEIIEVLQISFDKLEEREKNIFLLIVFFFQEYGDAEKDYLTSILDKYCNFNSKIGIKNLCDKSLLSVKDNELWVHDLLKEMGWKILEEKSLTVELGRKIKLWNVANVSYVWKNCTAIEGIEAVVCSDLSKKCPTEETFFNFLEVLSKMKKLKLLKLCGLDLRLRSSVLPILQNLSNELLILHWYDLFSIYTTKEIYLNCIEVILKMKKLKLLKLNGPCCFSSVLPTLQYLSNEILILQWRSCPFQYFPSSFQPTQLIEVDMSGSCICQLWDTIEPFTNLRSVRLSSCNNLTTIFDDFSLVPNLEVLDLSLCKKLSKIDPSITVLGKLTNLDLSECSSLDHLPPSLKGMESLQFLDVGGCSKLQKLPEDIGYLKSLEHLNIEDTAIIELPSSIVHLENFSKLFYDGVEKSLLKTIFGKGSLPVSLKCLKELDLSRCNLGLKSLEDLHFFISLERLNLSYNDFVSLPASISRLSKLKDLKLEHCSNLLSLTELPSSLQFLYLNNCIQLRSLTELPSSLQVLDLKHCIQLRSLTELPSSLKEVDVSECTSLDTFLDPSMQSNLPCTALCIGCHNLARRQGSERTILTSLQRYIARRQGSERTLPTWVLRYILNVGANTFNIILPGSKIPDWFTHQNIGSSSIDIKLDRNRRCVKLMMGFAFCMCFKARHPWSCYIHWRMKSKGNMCGYGAFKLPLYDNISDDHLCLLYVPRYTFESYGKWEISCADQMEFSFGDANDKLQLQICGVRIVYKQDVQELNSQEA